MEKITECPNCAYKFVIRPAGSQEPSEEEQPPETDLSGSVDSLPSLEEEEPSPAMDKLEEEDLMWFPEGETKKEEPPVISPPHGWGRGQARKALFDRLKKEEEAKAKGGASAILALLRSLPKPMGRGRGQITN